MDVRDESSKNGRRPETAGRARAPSSPATSSPGRRNCLFGAGVDAQRVVRDRSADVAERASPARSPVERRRGRRDRCCPSGWHWELPPRSRGRHGLLRSGPRRRQIDAPRGTRGLASAARLLLSFAACACAATPEPLPRLAVAGDAGARIAIGSGLARAAPLEVEIAGECVVPLEITLEGRVLRGALGVAYQPRAELAIALDGALLRPAMREDLLLLGWANDFSGATELVYLAEARAEADPEPLVARDLAQRYAGPVSGEYLAGLFLVALLTAGQGVTATGSPIEARRAEDAAWIEDDRRLRGLREGSACLFVRPRGGRDWIGPLFARGAGAPGAGDRVDADLADLLPRRPRPPSSAVGDGAHGQIALRLAADAPEPGRRRLWVDVRGVERLDAVLAVAAESAAVSELSHPGARAIEAGRDGRVVAWLVPRAELARGPLELSYRCASPAARAAP